MVKLMAAWNYFNTLRFCFVFNNNVAKTFHQDIRDVSLPFVHGHVQLFHMFHVFILEVLFYVMVAKRKCLFNTFVSVSKQIILTSRPYTKTARACWFEGLGRPIVTRMH